MDRLCRALSLSQTRSSNDDDDSKKKKDIFISKKIEKSLEDWKLPPCSASHVLKRGCIFNFSCDRTVKTVEKEIPLSDGYASFPLFTDNLQRVYENEDLNLRMGIIQVGLKPTKLGSNISAIICLRDKRRPKFHRSLLGMVESSLCDGPIFFSYFPTQIVSFSDPHLSSTFTIDIKTQGSSGDGNVILMYRFHYKVMEKCDPIRKQKLWRRSPIDGEGETTLFITNVGRRNRVVSKRIYWDQVSVPERWMDENNSPSASSSAAAAAAEQGAVARIEWKEAARGEYALKVYVPGFKREEVKVEVEADRSLVISGERSKEVEKEKGKWKCMERSNGKFLRRMTLPEDAKMDEMKAAMENGVLTVTVPIEDVSKKKGGKVIHISG